MCWFLPQLRSQNRYRYEDMELQSAVIDTDTLSEATSVQMGPRGARYVNLSSMCGCSKASWRRRPTQAQVDMVNETLGIEPR
jgi:hypothetical protein